MSQGSKFNIIVFSFLAGFNLWLGLVNAAEGSASYLWAFNIAVALTVSLITIAMIVEAK